MRQVLALPAGRRAIEEVAARIAGFVDPATGRAVARPAWVGIFPILPRMQLQRQRIAAQRCRLSTLSRGLWTIPRYRDRWNSCQARWNQNRGETSKTHLSRHLPPIHAPLPLVEALGALFRECSHVRGIERQRTTRAAEAEVTRALTASTPTDHGHRSRRKATRRSFVCSEKPHPCPWNDGGHRLCWLG